jgi:hypothetical protein
MTVNLLGVCRHSDGTHHGGTNEPNRRGPVGNELKNLPQRLRQQVKPNVKQLLNGLCRRARLNGFNRVHLAAPRC